MTIEEEDVVDIIATKEEENYVSLIISDHLEWNEKNEKLLRLQNKINSYLTYIESGQLHEDYPDCKNFDVRIELTCMHEPNSEGLKFLDLVAPVIEGAGFYFNWSVSGESS